MEKTEERMDAITAETVLAFGPAASIQPVGDGVVVLLADSGQLFTGNATTEAVLRLVDGRRRVAEIGAGLCMEFDVELDDAVGDVLGVAADLVEERVLVVVG
jgi:pyrroloquinoline quinone biosynthesis protein D